MYPLTSFKNKQDVAFLNNPIAGTDYESQITKTYEGLCPSMHIHKLRELLLINEWCPNFLNYLENDIMDG